MQTKILGIMVGLSLFSVQSAGAQIVSGVMSVTGVEMHWWGGVARDATARLYDVDDDSVVYKRPKQQGKYDHGTIGFRAKKGKLIDLDKLHESIWATRLSGGTRSGLVHLDVTAVGEATINGKQTTLNVTGTNRRFVLIENPDHKSTAGEKSAFERLQEVISSGESLVSVTGRLENWSGRWPGILSKKPSKPRRIMVTSFEITKK